MSVFYYVTVKDYSTMKVALPSFADHSVLTHRIPLRMQAGDDAADAEFYDVEELKKLTDTMAFDHGVHFNDLLDFIKKHNIEITRM